MCNIWSTASIHVLICPTADGRETLLASLHSEDDLLLLVEKYL
jgi:hypothetical protein